MPLYFKLDLPKPIQGSDKKSFIVKFKSIEGCGFNPEILNTFYQGSVFIDGFAEHYITVYQTIITEKSNPIRDMMMKVRNEMIPACLVLRNKKIIADVMYTYMCLSYCDFLIEQNTDKPCGYYNYLPLILGDIVKDYTNSVLKQNLCSVIESYISILKLTEDFTLENIDVGEYFKKYMVLLNRAKLAAPKNNTLSGKYASQLVIEIQDKSKKYFNNSNPNLQEFIKLSTGFDGVFNYENDYQSEIGPRVSGKDGQDNSLEIFKLFSSDFILY